MYKNWPQDKEIPEDMMIYNKVWVIPKFLEEFMPPDEVLKMHDCQVVQVGDDGEGEYDLFTHRYDEGDDDQFWRLIVDSN